MFLEVQCKMSSYYRVKQKNIDPNPSKGIYITKEERNKTIITVVIILIISILKKKIFSIFKK